LTCYPKPHLRDTKKRLLVKLIKEFYLVEIEMNSPGRSKTQEFKKKDHQSQRPSYLRPSTEADLEPMVKFGRKVNTIGGSVERKDDQGAQSLGKRLFTIANESFEGESDYERPCESDYERPCEMRRVVPQFKSEIIKDLIRGINLDDYAHLFACTPSYQHKHIVSEELSKKTTAELSNMHRNMFQNLDSSKHAWYINERQVQNTANLKAFIQGEFAEIVSESDESISDSVKANRAKLKAKNVSRARLAVTQASTPEELRRAMTDVERQTRCRAAKRQSITEQEKAVKAQTKLKKKMARMQKRKDYDQRRWASFKHGSRGHHQKKQN
jgi:hypothetical protein